MFIIGVILLTDIDIGSSFSRLGQYGSNSMSGSFLTGVLAVVVASPCTAPFMGAALGYALIQPSSVTLPIFISLGMGFAAPYFALSLSPGLVNKLPKPGQWMVTLKEFFAFPMFATALWLLWVFSLQTNIDLLIGLLISILFISMLFWILNRVNKKIEFYQKQLNISSNVKSSILVVDQDGKVQKVDNSQLSQKTEDNTSMLNNGSTSGTTTIVYQRQVVQTNVAVPV